MHRPTQIHIPTMGLLGAVFSLAKLNTLVFFGG